MTWIVSASPVVLAFWLTIGAADASSAFFALALLPWVLSVGLPRCGESKQRAGTLSSVIAYGSPLLALAVALDVADGGPNFALAEAWQGWLAGALYLIALDFAAGRAGAASRLHASLWFVLLVGAPVLAWLSSSLASPDQAFGWAVDPDWLASWSPLTFCLRLAAGDAAALTPTSVTCSTASVLALVAAAQVDRRRTC